MLKRTLVAVLTLAAVPVLSAVEDPPAPAEIEVGIVVKSTDFYAHNFSSFPQLLFFRSGSFYTWRVLQPGADFSSTYSRQALDGVTLEVAKYVSGTWRTTGSLNLSDVCDTGADALWVQGGAQTPTWLELENTLSLKVKEGSQLPSWMVVQSALPEPLLQPLHVPVVTPVDRPPGDTPPVLGDKPLPPF